jgi:hypothetical protein
MTWQWVVLILGLAVNFTILMIASNWSDHAERRSEQIRRSIADSEEKLSGQTTKRDTRSAAEYRADVAP